MKTITGPELRDAARAQRLPLEHRAFKCPRCATVQSAFDFIKAGAGPSFDSVAKHLGTSCVGRYTGAGAARATPDGKPCNWTLHGMLQLHTVEVIDDDGQAYPIFEPASPQEAQVHAAKNLLRQVESGERASTAYTLDDFFREAESLSLKAADLATALASRPEFAAEAGAVQPRSGREGFDQFMLAARDSGLTGQQFATALATRPEFADCLPQANTGGAQ